MYSVLSDMDDVDLNDVPYVVDINGLLVSHDDRRTLSCSPSQNADYAASDGALDLVTHTAHLVNLEHFLRKEWEDIEGTAFLSFIDAYCAAIPPVMFIEPGNPDATVTLDEPDRLHCHCLSLKFINFVSPLIHGIHSAALFVAAATFAFGTLLITAAGSALMCIAFFQMVSSPFAIFWYGVIYALLAFQIATITSRGLAITKYIFRGEPIPLLRLVHSDVQRLKELQTWFFVCALIAETIVAVIGGVPSGLQYAFGYGVIAAIVVIVLHHVFFPVGISKVSPHTAVGGEASVGTPPHGEQRANDAGLWVYLFLSLQEGFRERSASLYRRLGLAALPFAAMFVTGIGFIKTSLTVFLAICVTASVSLCFAVAFVTDGLELVHVSSMLRLLSCVLTLVWVWMSYAFGTFGFQESYAWCALLLGLDLLGWCFAARHYLLSRGHRDRRWSFRANWSLIVFHLSLSVGLTFYASPRSGGLLLLLLVHSASCYFSSSPVSLVGILVTAFMSVSLLMMCLLLGEFYTFENASVDLANPAGLFSSGIIDGIVPQFPYCAARLPGPLSPAALAQFTQVVEAVPSELPTEAAEWLPAAFGYSPLNAVDVAQGDWHVRIVSNAAQNVTLIGLGNSRNVGIRRLQVSFWSDSMVLYPFTLAIPEAWTASLLQGVAAVGWIPQPMLGNIVALRDAVLSLLQDLSPNQLTLIVGHGVAGGFAKIIGELLGIQAVGFNAPGTSYKADVIRYALSESSVPTNMSQLAFDVLAQRSSFSFVGAHPRASTFPCTASLSHCSEQSTLVTLIGQYCPATSSPMCAC
jgi:hypothetical protein